MKDENTELLRRQIAACEICNAFLPLGPRPIFQFSARSRLLIIGQAPGAKVHETGIPWDDPSGRLLRTWLGIDHEVFYDPDSVALMPMGFCYPGKGKSGDLAPRSECAPQWHHQMLAQMPKVQLTLLIGAYAQKRYLPQSGEKSLTERVKDYASYLPATIPLPHPSPRNRPWLHKNPWFERSLLPALQERIKELGFSD